MRNSFLLWLGGTRLGRKSGRTWEVDDQDDFESGTSAASGSAAEETDDDLDDLAGYDHYDELDSYYEAPRTSKPKPKRKSDSLLPGVVIRARGHHYDVQIVEPEGTRESGKIREAGQVLMCEVRGRLLQERGVDTLVAVGDRVRVVPDGKRRGRIEAVEERTSVLSRQHPGVAVPAEDVILANPDQLLVVFAAAQPDPHLRMLDRFLVIAEANELPAVICINKVELVDDAEVRAIFDVYEQIGYHVLYASAHSGEGVEELKGVLLDRVTVLSGPSGVGKSSLLNAVYPELSIHVGDLREVLDKGRHTTRAARLYALPMGIKTFVADTPGIRELGLYDIDPQDLGFYFLEFVPYIHDCRYPNCTHDHEPACAIRAAVERGDITQVRYDSYLRLLHGEDVSGFVVTQPGKVAADEEADGTISNE